MTSKKAKGRPDKGQPSKSARSPRHSKAATKKKPTRKPNPRQLMLADLKKSGLTPADAKKRGWKLLTPKQTQALTKTDTFAGNAAWSYLIVYKDIDRKVIKDYWRVRYLEDIAVFGQAPEKPRRYTGPKGAKLRIYLDPTVDYSLVRKGK
jgi:hypothetical protein